MNPGNNSNSRNTDPNDVKQNQAQFEEDSGQLTDSKNAAGGGPKSSEGGKPPPTDTRPSTQTNIVGPTVDDPDYDDDDDGIDDGNDNDTISSPQNLDNAPTGPIHSPDGVSITGIPNLDNKLQIERAELEATIALRKYLTACKAVQKDMLKKGDPKKAFMKYHEDVKDIPGAPSLPPCLRQTTDKGCEDDDKLLRNPDQYEGIIDRRIKDLENELNHKPTTDEDTWLNRESANAIAVLQSQGFYDREPYLPSYLRGNEIKAKAGDNASKEIRESKYISGSALNAPGRLYAAIRGRGVHYKVDPETRSVKARYRKNTFSRGTRSQAKSFFQGIVAAGRLGENPMNVVLNSKNPVIVRDQIKNLAEEAARRGIPLETIKIETPGLNDPNLKPQTLQEIVVDASRKQSQYDKKWNWGQMISPIRQSHLGKNFGQSLRSIPGVNYFQNLTYVRKMRRDSWADKLIREDQKERTDGTMGKKTVYTSEADVRAISNGSLYLDGNGHATMRIPEDSGEQPSMNQNRTNSIAWHDNNVKKCEQDLADAQHDYDLKNEEQTAVIVGENTPQANADAALNKINAEKAVELCEKALDKAKQERNDFANIAREDKTKSQADKTTMGMALEAYIKSESKYEDRALDFFDVVTETEKDPNRKFGGTGISEFGIELINDAKVGLADKMRGERTVCKRAKWARDKTRDEVKKLSGEIDVLNDEIDNLNTQPDKKSQVIAARKQLVTKTEELNIKNTKLKTQNDALDKSYQNFAKAYNRYHQAKCLSENEIADWEDIVTAKPLSNENPLDEDNELTEYRRGMLNPKDTRTIDDIMDDFNKYQLPIDQFDKNNTYKTIQAYAGKANDQYKGHANDTPVNATTEKQGLGNNDTDRANAELENELKKLQGELDQVDDQIEELQDEESPASTEVEGDMVPPPDNKELDNLKQKRASLQSQFDTKSADYRALLDKTTGDGPENDTTMRRDQLINAAADAADNNDATEKRAKELKEKTPDTDPLTPGGSSTLGNDN